MEDGGVHGFRLSRLRSAGTTAPSGDEAMSQGNGSGEKKRPQAPLGYGRDQSGGKGRLAERESAGIGFTLDGQEVVARDGETIWQVAQRRGIDIPHLCYSPEPGYRPDGNCRACMVEIKGERVLAASCIRKPRTGMSVTTDNERAQKARRMVMELLVADQPARPDSHDPNAVFWSWAERMGVSDSRFQPRHSPAPDRS